MPERDERVVADRLLDRFDGARRGLADDERVAERRVAKVADVRRLVGIDGGVFDDHLATRQRRPQRHIVLQAREQKRAAVQEEVQVAVGRGLHTADAVDRAKRLGQLLRDGTWRLAQRTGEFKRHRHRQIAQCAPRGCFNDDRGEGGRVKLKRLLERRLEALTDTGVNGQNHVAVYCTRRHSSGVFTLAVSVSGSPKAARASGPNSPSVRSSPSAWARRSPASSAAAASDR